MQLSGPAGPFLIQPNGSSYILQKPLTAECQSQTPSIQKLSCRHNKGL